MTDRVTVRVVEGETGPRLTFDRPVEFVEVPYDSVPALINELVLEFGRRRTGLTQRNLDAVVTKAYQDTMAKVVPVREVMDVDEVNEWATTPTLRDLEHYIKSLGFIQYPGRLRVTSQYNEGYLTWCNGTMGEGRTVVPWRQEMMAGLQELFRIHREQGYRGIVWRNCPAFEMRDGFGQVLRMRFHFINVTNI